MPFRIALSGLNAASSELRIIGNNVANASTIGFKKSRAEFADIFATSSLGTTSNAIGAGVRVSSISQQFTQGNIGFTDNNLDLALSGQGFFMLNDNGVAVYSRAGSFGVDRDGFVVNSQGQSLLAYSADSTGNITGATSSLQLDTSDIAPQESSTVTMGLNLDASASVPAAPVTSSVVTLGGTQVLDTADSPITTAAFGLVDSYGNAVPNGTLRWTYSGTGNDWTAELLVGGVATAPATTAAVTVGTTTSATLNWDPDGASDQSSIAMTMDTTGVSQVTTGGAANISATVDGAVQGNFSAADSTSYNSSTSLTIYDTLGTSHLATMYYRKTGTPNIWEMYTYVDGSQIQSAAAGAAGQETLAFTSSGQLTSVNGTPIPPATLTTQSFTPTGGAAAMTLTFNVSSVNQYGSNFAVNTLAQDGFATGRLSGVDIADTGVITARFTNGQSRTLGQVALANFQNSQGLRQLGDTTWGETFESGAALVGQPGSGSLGLIESGALEGSNVDLTEQLVGMITAQRNFQANAQVITTADTVTQTIINIR